MDRIQRHRNSVNELREKLKHAESELERLLNDSDPVEKLAQELWVFITEMTEDDSTEIVEEARASDIARYDLWHSLTIEYERERYRSIARKILEISQ